MQLRLLNTKKRVRFTFAMLIVLIRRVQWETQIAFSEESQLPKIRATKSSA